MHINYSAEVFNNTYKKIRKYHNKKKTAKRKKEIKVGVLGVSR